MYDIVIKLIQVIHGLFILFMMFAPLSNNLFILIMQFIFGCSLIIHWSFNDQTCALTLLEKHVRGVDDNESFIYQIVGPVYGISNTDMCQIAYVILIISMAISLYKIRNHPELGAVIKKVVNFKDRFL